MALLSLSQLLPALVFLAALIFGLWRWYTPGLHLRDRQLFWLGFAARLSGALAFVLVYQIVYHGGDSFLFYQSALVWRDLLLSNPGEALELWGYGLWNSPSRDAQLQDIYGRQIFYIFAHPDPVNVNFWRLLSVLSVAALGSYWLMTIWLGLLAFLAQWLLLRRLSGFAPAAMAWLAIPLLFLPSTVFWTGSLMKDTLIQAGTALLLSGLVAFWQGVAVRLWFQTLLLTIAGCFLIISIKDYFLLALLPFLGMALVVQAGLRFRLSMPGIWLGLLAVGALSIGLCSAAGYTPDYILEYAYLHRNYSIEQDPGLLAADRVVLANEFEPRWGSFLASLPIGLATTLLMPMPWQIQSASALALFAENVFVLAFCTLLIAHTRRKGLLKKLLRNPSPVLLILFALIYMSLLGVSSSFLGTLVRYRVVSLVLLLLGVLGLQLLSTGGRPPAVALPNWLRLWTARWTGVHSTSTPKSTSARKSEATTRHN